MFGDSSCVSDYMIIIDLSRLVNRVFVVFRGGIVLGRFSVWVIVFSVL